MNQTSHDLDLRKIVLCTLSADAIIQKIAELNLTDSDILVLKMDKSATYNDVNELSTHIQNLAGDKKFKILMETHDISYETMPTEELVKLQERIDSLLGSRNA